MSDKQNRRGAASLFTETETALVQVMVFLIGSTMVAEPERREGFDRGLAHFRDEFLRKGEKHSAAVIEHIRRESTDVRSPASQAAALRKPAIGEG